MLALRLFTLAIALILTVTTVCSAQDMPIRERPIRPARFDDASEAKNYATKLKAFYANSGIRFGKRFVPLAYRQQRPELSEQDWQSLYRLFKNFDVTP